MKASVSALLSLVVGLLVTFLFVGYGVTEEVPVGSLNGVVVMKENGRPLPGAFVTITRIEKNDLYDEEDIASEHHFRVDKSGHFHLRSMLAGDYEMEVTSKAHSLDGKNKEHLRIVEGKPTDQTLEAIPKDPYLEMYASQRVYLPSETPKIQLKGFTPGSTLDTSIYKLDFDKVVKEGGMYNALAPLARPDKNKPSDPAKMGSLINHLQYDLKTKDAEGTFTDRLPVPNLGEGLYWIQCNIDKESKGTWLSVSKIAIIVKHTDDKLSAFVTTLDSGEPVVGATVGFATPAGVVAKATTSAQGLTDITLPKKQGTDTEVVVASLGESRALVDFRRATANDQSSDEGDDSGDSSSDGTETRIYTYTDRPIYRPGDLVQFKGIVRQLVGSNYQLPKATKVTARITDGSGDILSEQTLPLNSMGAYAGSYKFSTEASPDNYSLTTLCGKGSSSKDIGVAAYRKPTYSIKVHPEKPNYVRGEKARVFVDAQYYYGAPVVGANVTASISRSPYWDWRDYADSETDYEDYYSDESPDQSFFSQGLTGGSSGEGVQEVKAITDGNGRAVIEFPTIGVNESAEAASDYTYTVAADVKDQSDKSFSGTGDVEVLRSEEKITLDTGQYIGEAGQPFTVKTAIKDADGKPLPGVAVQLTSGFIAWGRRGIEILQDRKTDDIVTGPDGTASLNLSPQGAGSYQLEARFTDRRGHVVTKTTDLFLYTDKPLWESEQDKRTPDTDLSILLDKKRYKSGDTVRALVTCNKPGGTAMVGVEGGLMYSIDTLKLSKKTTLYEFKVLLDYSPNAFVSVAYVKDKHFAETSKQLVIDLGVRKLDVQVTPDKLVYHPGDVAVYTITTKNALGAPTPAEVSLGVVDESIYAIFDDHSDIVKGFYPKRFNRVQTDYSFPEMYLGGGDKAPTGIQIRRKFEDTAFWMPSVETDKTGEAKVSVKLPDNITSWRATCRAVTADTEVGQASMNAIARKDLMVQLSAPTYVVNGDQERLVAMVTNNTGTAADVKVQLTANNAKVEGDMNATVHVDNGAVQTVEYKMTPEHSGEADFTAKAWVPTASSFSDGMELKVPVTPHARLVSDGYSGSTNASKSLDLELQPGADHDAGNLVVSVAPTIATSLLGSVDSLIQYPYGCVEQTTSRFFPAVIFVQAFKDLGLPKPKLADQIPKIVQDSYSRLKTMEHEDGAWGWWENDDSDPAMTAYVLDAMYHAKLAGYDVPKDINLSKALDWAAAFVKDPEKHLKLPFVGSTDRMRPEEKRALEVENAAYRKRFDADVLYLSYALILQGKRDDALAYLRKLDVTKLDAAQASMLALAANSIGASELAIRDHALNRMMFLANRTRSTVGWAEEDWWGLETTGRCFAALETIRPNDPDIEKIVSLLMQKRRGDMWYSTRDTSSILIPMASYLRHTKELLTDSDIVVRLNGRELNTVHFQKGAFPDKPSQVKVPIADLQQGKNELELQARNGVCYYTVALKQYVAAPDLQPIAKGGALVVSRAYYKMESRRMEDGTLKLMASKQPVTSYKSGDILQCTLKIHTDAQRAYLFVEDPTPSGLHVTDREEPDYASGEKWAYWWSRTVILDDRVALFAKDVPSGDSVMSYVLRAENPGTCHALPTTIYNMYDPSDMASSGEVALVVTQ